MVDIKEVYEGYELHFKYKPFLVADVKKIPGNYFRFNKKTWFVPATSIDELKVFAKKYKAKFSDANIKPEMIGQVAPLPKLQVHIPLLMEMYEYQKDGTAYAIDRRQCIIGDEPGLGKTVQSIAATVFLKTKCCLIVCPASLKENWRREIKMWTGLNAMVLSDRVKGSWMQYNKVGMCRYFITNYESLKKYFVQEINKPENVPLRLNHIKFRDTINIFDTVIIDELHRVKEGKNQSTKFVMGITKGKENIFGLTGTPLVNTPKDLITQLHIIGQLKTFGGYTHFVERYCDGEQEASNLGELNYLLNKHCFYRRLKKDVLKELPEKSRYINEACITNRAEYDKAEKSFILYLKENLNKSKGEIDRALRGEAMVLIGVLKKIAARGKLEQVIAFAEDIISSGEKVVLFAWHKEIVYELHKYLPGSVTLTGDDNEIKKQLAVDTFQNNPECKCIILNIKSGGVGFTLTASSRVGFIELPWNPATGDQCEDRIHRIGQKDAAQAYWFLGADTVDYHIWDIIERKRKIADQVMNGNISAEEDALNAVDELINIYKKKIV
jgi:SWI/SNF-related matrix-associated actin-dependent regulator 1 of chromatin subfamily A